MPGLDEGEGSIVARLLSKLCFNVVANGPNAFNVIAEETHTSQRSKGKGKGKKKAVTVSKRDQEHDGADETKSDGPKTVRGRKVKLTEKSLQVSTTV